MAGPTPERSGPMGCAAIKYPKNLLGARSGSIAAGRGGVPRLPRSGGSARPGPTSGPLPPHRTSARTPPGATSVPGSATTAGLAGRTVEGRALALDDPTDGGPAAAARLPRSVVDSQALPVAAGLVPEGAIGAEGGSHAPDRLAEHPGRPGRDRLPLLARERSRAPPGFHTGAVEDLARVDIADPGEPSLVEQVFAEPSHGSDAQAAEAPESSGHRPAEPCARAPRRGDRASDDLVLEHATQRLDLGQLGHGATLCRARLLGQATPWTSHGVGGHASFITRSRAWPRGNGARS